MLREIFGWFVEALKFGFIGAVLLTVLALPRVALGLVVLWFIVLWVFLTDLIGKLCRFFKKVSSHA